MLSGIQHFAFCRRQWALIHIEQQWAENYRTIDGQIFHENAHNDTFSESRNGILIRRGLSVFQELWELVEYVMLLNFIHQKKEYLSPMIASAIYQYLLSIREENPSNIRQMICSFVHRQCVWKKCFYAILIKDICIMERRGEELKLCFLRICGKQ